MPAVHRNGDLRVCGGATVGGASGVFVNGIAVSLQGDPCTHIAGGLHASNTRGVYAEGRKIVLAGSLADPDKKCDNNVHCQPAAAGGSPDVFCHG